MKRILLALTAAVIVGAAGAAPASALSFQVDFPNLTFPPEPQPDTTQGCADLTTLNGETCTATSK